MSLSAAYRDPPPNKALELTGHRSACRALQLPAAGHGGVGDPGRLTGVRPMGRGTFTGRQLNAWSVGRHGMESWRRFVWSLEARIPIQMRFRIGGLLMLLGLIGFLGSVVAILLGATIPGSVQLPLSDVGNVVVDSQANLYVASQAYARLQKYDSAGRFLLGVHVPAAGGAFQLARHGDNLAVVPKRTRTRILFDTGLRLISEQGVSPQLYSDLKYQDSAGTRSVAGDTHYEVRDFILLYPRVVRVTAAGERSVLVRSPLYLWPFTSPMPAFLFIVLGLLLRR